jgi:hypothetical protein
VPTAQASPHAGYGIVSLDILKYPRAHDLALLRRRVRERNALYDSPDPKRRLFSLGKLLRFGRPAAVLIEHERHASLHSWLETDGKAQLLHSDPVYAVWLLDLTRAVD